MRLFLIVFLGLHVFPALKAQSVREKAEELIQAYVRDKKFNGSVLVAKDGQILMQKGFGVRDASIGAMNDATSIFQVGSITKQFTAAIILQLERENKLSLSDKISKYFPGFPRGGEITIEHLLTHTSGIYNYTNDRDFMLNGVTIPHSRDQMIALFRDKPLNFEPGSKWDYSNSAYVLLGFIIEQASGKTYEQNIRQRIFQPLEMASSGFDFTHLNDTRKATGYFALSNPPEAAPIVDSTVAYSAGAVYTTVTDLYKWDRALYTDKILDAASKKRSFTPFKNKYGYGWSIDSLHQRFSVAHGGGIHGFSSFILRFPDDDAVIIAIDNSGSSSVAKMSRTLAAILFDQPYEIPKEQKTVSVESKILEQFAGEYELTPGFIITIRLKDGELHAQATGQQEFQLFAETENTFFLKVVDAKLEFLKNDTGKIDRLVLYQAGQKMPANKIK